MLYPLAFKPLVKQRVWGGRRLGELYGKHLPDEQPYGESWEVTDRPEGVSEIINGPLTGRTLNWLVTHHSLELLGAASAPGGRFPLLLKILDAQDKLSLQVHPPAAVASALGGEPKTEMWYVADARPGAGIYVGLKRGVTKSEFESALANGTVEQCFHRISVKAGDVMFLPSGRVHALGEGLIIFEIQQNSDTTYRVFDWNRKGLDGKPRELHIEKSLQCIDFQDIEPTLAEVVARKEGDWVVAVLGDNPLFKVTLASSNTVGAVLPLRARGVLQILACVAGGLKASHPIAGFELSRGGFGMIPASCDPVQLEVVHPGQFLVIEPAC